jgi:hypothetical protein
MEGRKERRNEGRKEGKKSLDFLKDMTVPVFIQQKFFSPILLFPSGI